ncbi:MAG: OmpP1/FadL family transporter [Gemmatimonadaceae bacterium]
MGSHRVMRRIALLSAWLVPAAVQAQGFGLNEIGSCAVARGYALTGLPCDDASVIYWNPAAATRLTGLSVYAGVAAIMVNGDFTADTTGALFEGDVPVEYPPHLFVNYETKWGFAAGLGVYVPYGLTSQWREDFPGRFSALKASLATIYVQPNIAFELVPGRVSIGGGPVFGHSDVELIQSLDIADVETQAGGPTFGQLGIAANTEFARASLEGGATAWGFHVGVHTRITPEFEFGARYLSELEFKYDDADASFRQISTGLVFAANNPLGLPAGTEFDDVLAAQFAAGGALVDQKVSTTIRHPAQFQAGIGYSGLASTKLSLDYEWIDWSAFDELPVDFQGPAAGNNRLLIEDYEDSWSVRTGIEYTLGSGGAAGMALRGGFSYVSTPAPDVTVTPLLPDMNRYNIGLGIGIPFGGRYALDASYLRVETEGRRGRIAERDDRSQTAADLNSGFYTLDANVFSVSLKAQF